MAHGIKISDMQVSVQQVYHISSDHTSYLGTSRDTMQDQEQCAFHICTSKGKFGATVDPCISEPQLPDCPEMHPLTSLKKIMSHSKAPCGIKMAVSDKESVS